MLRKLARSGVRKMIKETLALARVRRASERAAAKYRANRTERLARSRAYHVATRERHAKYGILWSGGMQDILAPSRECPFERLGYLPMRALERAFRAMGYLATI